MDPFTALTMATSFFGSLGKGSSGAKSGGGALGGINDFLGSNLGQVGMMLGGGALSGLLNKSSEPDLKALPTQTPLQQGITRDMLEAAMNSFRNYAPYPGQTMRTQPTATEKSIFSQAGAMAGRVGQPRGGNADVATARGEVQKPKSTEALIAEGLQRTLSSVLKNIGG